MKRIQAVAAESVLRVRNLPTKLKKPSASFTSLLLEIFEK